MKAREIMNNVLLIVFCTLVTICLIVVYTYCQHYNIITTGWYDGVYFTLKDIDWETTCRIMTWCVFMPAVLGVFVFGNICCYLDVMDDIRRIKKYYTK